MLMAICLLRSTAKSVSIDHKNEFTVTLSHHAFLIYHSDNYMKTLFLLVAAGSESGQRVRLKVLLFPCKWRHGPPHRDPVGYWGNGEDHWNEEDVDKNGGRDE